MKVLLVTPSYYPVVGGSETLTKILSTELNHMGICADVMTLNMKEKWKPIWKEETTENGSMRIIKMPAFNPFSSTMNPLYSLIRMNVVPKPTFLRKLKSYDIIHFISEADLGFPLLSYFVKKPKIMHCCGIFRNGGVYWYYVSRRPYLRSIFMSFFPNLADTYFVYSVEAEELLAELGVSRKKTLILPYCVDTKIFRPDETKKIDNLILFVGRIERIKGLHILTEALNSLTTPVQLVIIGPKADKEYFGKIEETIKAINQRGFHEIRLLETLDPKALAEWYQKASVVVCPYLYETYSLVALEALSCGTPVVSTGTHAVEQGSDGILVTQKDSGKLANALEKLLKNKEMRKNYGKDGTKIVEQYFSEEAVAKKLVKFYESILRRYSRFKVPNQLKQKKIDQAGMRN